MKTDKTIRVALNEEINVKGLICQVNNEEVDDDYPKANALSWKQFGYNFYDISDWKVLREYAEKYGYVFTEEANSLIKDYCETYKKYDNISWNYEGKIINFEMFCQLIEDKSGVWKREIKDYLADHINMLIKETVLDALCDGLKIVKEKVDWIKANGAKMQEISLKTGLMN